MKKPSTKSFTITIFLIVAIIISGNSQPCNAIPDGSTMPVMWFTKEEGQLRVNDFWKIKAPVLRFNTNVDQIQGYSLGNFIGLLSYLDDPTNTDYTQLRVYIGMYPMGGENVPPGLDNQLILLFARENSNNECVDKDKYYLIPPGGSFDTRNIGQFTKTAAQKDALERYYLDHMPLATIDPNNPVNKCSNCTYKPISDTRSVVYYREDLRELITEIGYCHTDINTAQPIVLSNNLVAYFSAINVAPRARANYRIALQFEFTDITGKIIALEDTYDVKLRVENSYAKKLLKLIDNAKKQSKIIPPLFGVDNGQLCPTYCPK